MPEEVNIIWNVLSVIVCSAVAPILGLWLRKLFNKDAEKADKRFSKIGLILKTIYDNLNSVLVVANKDPMPEMDFSLFDEPTAVDPTESIKLVTQVTDGFVKIIQQIIPDKAAKAAISKLINESKDAINKELLG